MQVLKHKTARFRDKDLFTAEYNLAVEELLEIFVNNAPYAVAMRLPGSDIALAAGFCLTEGLIRSRDDLLAVTHCDRTPNVVRVTVKSNGADPGAVAADNRGGREYFSKSSCGLCGKSRPEEVYRDLKPVVGFHSLGIDAVLRLRSDFEEQQCVYQLTGSTHSASIFGFNGDRLAFAEDIGRHNAFDKAIGLLLLENKMQRAFIALVSSRLSFEMLQKAGVIGVEILAGLSAPTSMAVEMAQRLNITLIGFLRENGMSIYTHPERIIGS